MILIWFRRYVFLLKITFCILVLMFTHFIEAFYDNKCKINNDDDLSYLNFNLLPKLKIPEDSGFVLSKFCVDYHFHFVNEGNIIDDKQKIGRQLNVCPPNLLIN